MERLGELLRRLRHVVRKRRFERELEDEIAFHLDMKARENRDAGADAEEARYAARRQFGNATLLREAAREAWSWRWLDSLCQDLRYGFRTLRNNAGFSAIAVLTLALGIGANTAVFSVLNAVLLRDLPVDDPSRLVSFTPERSFSYPDYLDFRDQNSSFDGVCAVYPNAVAGLSGGDVADSVLGEVVSANNFAVAGVRPVLGRGFVAEEDARPSAVVVLSYALWRRNFGADAGVLGKTVRINGTGYTVVGIAPEGFRGVQRGVAADFWAPLSMAEHVMPWAAEAKLLATRDQRGFLILGRLKRDITLEQAAADVRVIGDRIRNMTGFQRSKTVSLMTAGALAGPRARQVVSWTAALMGVVAILLLLACANVANFQLARAVSRRREIGIRLAMGGGRSRIVRQLLTESALLSAMGGALGFALAVAAVHPLAQIELPSQEKMVLDVSPDARVLVFTALLSIGTALAFGLAPAMRATRHDPVRGLKGETSGSTMTGSGVRNLLVAAQVALSVMLVACAGLFLRSLWKTLAVDPGFRADSALVLRIDPRRQGYSRDDTIRLFRSLEQRLAAVPGVRSMSFASIVPLSNFTSGRGFRADTQQNDRPRQANVVVVSAGYFETLGVPLLHGRNFDRTRSDPQTVINESAARLFFPGEDPIGRRILTYNRTRAYEVIGVVPDAKGATLTEAPAPYMYQLFDQEPASAVFGMGVLVRTGVDPRAMIKPVRDQIAALDRDLAVQDIETMHAHIQKALSGSRLSAALFGIFGVLGLTIAAVGLYGLMSYTVRCRTKEIAIRAALGASSIEVAHVVSAKGLAAVFFGIAAGLAAALAASRVVSSFLYGITATDTATFLVTPAVLVITALAATAIPARRATRIDPMEALRYE